MTPEVKYVPNFLTQEDADTLLSAIKAHAEFGQNTFKIFGKSHLMPRREAWYSSWDYPYSSGIVLRAKPVPD